jgi:deazaflavin-dependent oxidoreductase (nitroreductase family)
MQRYIGNRLAPLFQPTLVSKLSVRGRRTGQWRTVPVAVMTQDGERYLVSYRGESDWSRNLRKAKHGRLASKEQVDEITVAEVPVGERARLLELYASRYAKMPTVGRVLRALPDPADHPIFRITAST